MRKDFKLTSFKLFRSGVLSVLVTICAFTAPYATADEALKQRTQQSLSQFLVQFRNYEFGRVISLGDMNRFRQAFSQNLNVDYYPNLGMAGKYWPNEALVGTFLRNHLLTLGTNDLNNYQTKMTIYHESLHHLIYLYGKQPCGPEETYTELAEDRIKWLRKVAQFETNYRNGRLSKEQARREWDKLEREWQQFTSFRNGNLSGPYAWQDPQGATCYDKDRIYTIDSRFIRKLDTMLGIDIDVYKIRNVYEGIWTKTKCPPGYHWNEYVSKCSTCGTTSRWDPLQKKCVYCGFAGCQPKEDKSPPKDSGWHWKWYPDMGWGCTDRMGRIRTVPHGFEESPCGPKPR